MQGLYHRLYQILLRLGVAYLRVTWLISKKTNRNQNHGISILALPSYPENWPGGKERFANWKSYFEDHQIQYDVEWPCATPEYLVHVGMTLSMSKFLFHYKVLKSRIRVLSTVQKYNAVYVQREFIPLYYSTYFGYDKILMKHHNNVIYDFYDADYEATPEITNYIFQNAPKITVASRFLENLVQQYCRNVLFTRICLPLPESHPKLHSDSIVRIGWMGSPGNARNLLDLEDTFSALQKQFPHIEFSFVCRNPPSLNCTSILWSDMNSASFHYAEWLNSIDIGIVPYMDYTDRTKAKTAMKSLEFWANSIAMVCSPFGMSDKIEDGFNCLIASDVDDWYEKIASIISNQNLRQTLATNGFDTFSQFHTYNVNFEDLRTFLLQE